MIQGNNMKAIVGRWCKELAWEAGSGLGTQTSKWEKDHRN